MELKNKNKAIPSYGAGGATAPAEKLASECIIKYFLFIAASY